MGRADADRVSTPDIYLGPGDTFPVTRFVLRGPDLEDGSDGDPVDLSSAVQVVFRYQLRSASQLAANRMMVIASPATDGQVTLDWLTTGGGIPSGDYNARVIVTFADGHVESFPQLRPGDDPSDEFFWLHVGRDFIAIPGMVSLFVLDTDLASTAVGLGASMVGVQDAANLITSGTVEGALEELAAGIVALAAVVDPDLAILASTALGGGASRVGIQDAAGLIAATTVEGALGELATMIGGNTTAIAARALTSDVAAAVSGLTATDTANAATAASASAAAAAAAATANAGLLLRPLTADLAALTVGKGASLIGIQDAGNLIAAATVEGALAELATSIASGGAGIIPLTRGGTGQITAAASYDALAVTAPALTAAATIDLSLAGCPGSYAVVNGAGGPITSFGVAPAGTARVLRFAATPTITHNAVSLILPGGANIVAAAGDVMFLHSLGSGNWRCTSYTRAASMVALANDLAATTPALGASLIGIQDAGNLIAAATVEGALAELATSIASGGAGIIPLTRGGTGQITAAASFDALTVFATSIPAAATVDLSLASCPGTSVVISGSGGPITSFGTAPPGTQRVVRFSGTPTIVHNTAAIVLPGVANIVAAVGDVMFLQASPTAGVWKCTNYLRNAAAPWNADASALTQGTLALALGGTGQNTANAALTALQALTGTQVSLINLADATNSGDTAAQKAPVLSTLRHATSGTTTTGLGAGYAVNLMIAAGTERQVMTDLTKYTSATNGAEVANRTISVMNAGALVEVLNLTPTATFVNNGAGRLSTSKIGFVDSLGALASYWTMGYESLPAGAVNVTTAALVTIVYGAGSGQGWMLRNNNGVNLFEVHGFDGKTVISSVDGSTGANTTAPDILIRRHLAPGATPGVGYGLVSGVDLHSSTNVVRRAMNDTVKWLTPTNAAEVSTRTIQLMKAGTLADVATFLGGDTALQIVSPNATYTTPTVTIESASGVGYPVLHFKVNGGLKGGLRADYTGGMALFSNGSYQHFYVGGDNGILALKIHATGHVTAGNFNDNGAEFQIVPPARATGSPTLLSVVGPAHTTLAASVEAPDITFNLARSVQFATGALAAQRAILIQSPTYAFVAASTIGTAATVAIAGAPIAGANATITNSYALWTQAGMTRHDLADAATSTTPEIFALRHTTSGTAAAGFGVLSAVDLQSGAGNVRRAMTDTTSWVSSTDTAEESQRQITGFYAGVASTLVTFGSFVGFPAIKFGAVSDSIAIYKPNSTTLSFYNGVTGAFAISSTSVTTTIPAQFNDRIAINPLATTSGVLTKFALTLGADTGTTASTEAVDVDFNLTRTRTWATGALATQRAVFFRAPTYAFVAASTITDAATVSISNCPAAGANATITNPYALRIEAGNTRLDGKIGINAPPSAQMHLNLTDDTTPSTVTAWDSRHFFFGSGATGTSPGIGVSYSVTAGTANFTCVQPGIAWKSMRFNAAALSFWASGGVQTFYVDGVTSALNVLTAIAPVARTSGSPVLLTVTGPAHTTLTAAEASDVVFNLGRSVQFATGNFATQRAVAILAPTYAFVAASTIGTAASFAISGAPILGTNATAVAYVAGSTGVASTFPNTYSLWTQSGIVRHDLSDATNTVLEGLTLRRTTSTTAAAGLGVQTSIDIQNAGGFVRRGQTDVTKLLVATDGAETVGMTTSLLAAGTMLDLFALDSTLNSYTCTLKNANTDAVHGQLNLVNTAGVGQSLISFTSGAGVVWGTIRADYIGGLSIKAGATGPLNLYAGAGPNMLSILSNSTMGFFGVTPVAKPATTGTATGFTAGAGTGVTDASTFTGGTGASAYRVSDIVLALKSLGLLAA